MRFPDAVTVLRPTGVDEYGNPDHSWANPLATETVGFLSGDTVYLPPGTDVLKGDRLLIGERTYTVADDPGQARSPSRTVLVTVTVKVIGSPPPATFAVKRSGDTMTGALVLVDGSPAASEAYVLAHAVEGGETVAWANVLDKPAAFPPVQHGHPLAEVAGLAATLAALAPAIRRWNGTAYVTDSTAAIYVGPADPGDVPDGSVWIDTSA
ncbi:hypothetical protein GCM10010168_53310 [Actinoplanes ianthinogenes]|uniref:Uncharacterized protein n=1 Tax=Actinoplanes ianthinogenes TaxID=122358 RepID=A0ABM7LR28_9ACTN|nr:hypothetical protein [Actinoplanes ianthinogenes]BCJ41671.1 hypothetical protein Aiant_23280 [Actinoplanes ianthinogenes]GGR28520.1 hypothetical protein GCM10010168_53310 [Actinoplanes ianthinogenes]